jgi:hypothetical protein
MDPPDLDRFQARAHSAGFPSRLPNIAGDLLSHALRSRCTPSREVAVGPHPAALLEMPASRFIFTAGPDGRFSDGTMLLEAAFCR